MVLFVKKYLTKCGELHKMRMVFKIKGGNDMKKSNKLKIMAAFLLCVCFLTVITFSHLFIVEHVHHECSGKECPICAQILVVEHAIQQLSICIKILTILVAFAAFISVTVKSVQNHLFVITPITQKVRMND